MTRLPLYIFLISRRDPSLTFISASVNPFRVSSRHCDSLIFIFRIAASMLSSASPSVINSRPVFFSSLPDLLAGGGAAFFPADPLLRRCGLPLLPGAEPPLREADPGVAVARRLSAAGGVLRSAMALMVHAAEVGVAVVDATVLRGLRVETQRESVALSVLGLPTTAVCCRRAPSETGIRATRACERGVWSVWSCGGP